MLKLDQIENVFFIGIGGIGMSALARYFKSLGCQVAGYDRTETPLTKALVQEGIPVFYVDDTLLIDEIFLKLDGKSLVIYTPAIPSDLAVKNYFIDKGVTLHKRSEVLGIISSSRKTIAIAGTHGKTTTSSLVAHLLTDSGFGCSAFLGGIASNYNTNTLISDSEWVVVEADEYDRSFLTLYPQIAILTSADADHLDIYGTHVNLQIAMRQFLNQVRPDGFKIVHDGLPFESNVVYSLDKKSPVYGDNIRVEDGYFVFDYFDQEGTISHIQMGIPGKHNIENAVAAIRVARELGISSEAIKKALKNFKGVKRRFEYIFRGEQSIYIDDYAHHPQEIRAFLNSVKMLYPDKKATLVFQPHLYTRTRDFMDGFAEVLSMADNLWLMDVYPARELPIPGISSEELLKMCTNNNKILLTEEEVLEKVTKEKPELLLTVGAGNIDRLIEPLRTLFNEI